MPPEVKLFEAVDKWYHLSTNEAKRIRGGPRTGSPDYTVPQIDGKEFKYKTSEGILYRWQGLAETDFDDLHYRKNADGQWEPELRLARVNWRYD